MPTWLTVFGLIFAIILFICFIGYGITTDKIIKKQEKEIAQLRTELHRQKSKEPLYIEKSGKTPKFGGF